MPHTASITAVTGTGPTDNAILRADGTGGGAIQTSLATVTDAGTIEVPNGQGIDCPGDDLAIGATAAGVTIGGGGTPLSLDGDTTVAGYVTATTVSQTAPETALDAITGKVAHWRADRGVTSDVNGVSVWTDSVSSRTLSQSTNSKKPAVSTLRGKAALSFDGGDVLVSDEAAANWKFLHDGTGVTICIVWRRSEITGGRGVFDTCNQPISGSAATVGVCIYSLSGATSTQAVCSRANATPTFDVAGKSSTYVSTHFDILRHKTSGSPGERDYCNNGRHFIAAYGGAASGSNPTYTLHVGAFADESNALIGYISEIIIFNKYLTDAEFDVVETYWGERYRYSPDAGV